MVSLTTTEAALCAHAIDAVLDMDEAMPAFDPEYQGFSARHRQLIAELRDQLARDAERAA